MLRTVFLYIALHIIQTAAWQVPADYAITPSPDGRFLQQSNGAPFFWQADTAWLLFHRLNYSEAETYLSDRARKGFTVVLAVGFTQEGIASPNCNGDLTFIDEDVTRPNEAYWAYIDSIVSLAWSKGIRICMVPAWGKFVHGSDNSASVLNATTAPTFGKFIGQRYPYLPKTLVADTNPYWQNKTAVKADYSRGGVPPTYEVIDWSPVYDALAEGIVAGERQALSASSSPSADDWWPLMTIHPTNQWFTGGPIALAHAFLGNRSWLTLDSSQSGHADYAPNPPIPWWNCRRGWEPVELMYAAGSQAGGRPRPVIDNEAHYEHRYNNGNHNASYWNASDVRIGSWQAVFSGAAGLTYGANAVQQMAIPGLFQSDGSGPGDNWATDLVLPGSSQMQWIQKVVMDRGASSYFRRVPAQDLLVGDVGADDARVTATRDRDGGWILVYTPTGKSFQVDTRSLKSCAVQASWYDPLRGVYSRFDYTQCEQSLVRSFMPPTAGDHVDWVLVLEVLD
ncbi:glycoside hydrolase family 140 protein [Aspergillus homomorphus CBS 101889]|uniref:DUF4038 domain-containing protein n=1 Tax=Aspergillus homomorphus (strain CBS 101889) TaxID=1450537 RepID=A0A395IF23_ASPHC|nr:hypothetical protein BO97DRAFT_439734 [Aspergillus homomorphus CBS 101889]RAL16774.1 hypothetical protein BO97DRAFT_439734 [Aspergillus homomorphus CBS 101889]